MKLSLTILFSILHIVFCFSQYKTIDVYFPDSVYEKEVTLQYSIYDILNYLYEPYMNTQKTKENYLSFEIPDSISTLLMVLPSAAPYRWEKNIILLMKSKEKLAIHLDTIHPPQFEGDNVRLHQFMYSLKTGSGVKRTERILNDFMKDSSTTSFYDFINQKVAMNIAILDSLLSNRSIDTTSYTFAKDQTIDDYLYRVAMIGLGEIHNYFSKIDSICFYSDLDKLFTRFDDVYDWGISLTQKAELRAMGLISGSKLDLGLDFIYWFNSYLNRDEQEREAASEMITNNAVGKLDSLQLGRQRNKYKEVFPNSIYNGVLDQLKPLNQKDYILADYSKEKGFQEYGRFKTNDLKKITGMFMGETPVFIDFWATWCNPCIKEFEHLKDFKKFSKENNIGILYVSLDYPGAYDKWKRYIEELQLEGLHYFGGQKFVDQLPYFKEDRYIPRYVLLDKNSATLIDKCELPSSGNLIRQIKEKLGIK